MSKSRSQNHMTARESEKGEEESARVLQALRAAFFEPIARMQESLAILCDGQQQQSTDPVTHTILTMLSCPIHLQLTAIGWQPFKGKELTLPYQRMTSEQKDVLRAALPSPQAASCWRVHEHAITYHSQTPPEHLKAIDVLEALCTTILRSKAYADRRLRVAVCNILLQRIQSSVQIDKSTLRTLNTILFPAQDST